MGEGASFQCSEKVVPAIRDSKVKFFLVKFTSRSVVRYKNQEVGWGMSMLRM